jgi:hypothetical protein
MSGRGAKMKAYNDLRSEYLRKIEQQTRVLENLKSELAGVERLYRASEGIPEVASVAAPPERHAAQRNVKKYVFDTVIDHGDRGVNATEIVAQGRLEGLYLNGSSVSSLLSRLKREGTLKLVNDRYYPAKSDASGAIVTPIRPVEAA